MPDYESIFSSIEEDVFTLDRDWKITSCNERVAINFGLGRGQVIGRTPFEINPGFTTSVFYAPIEETMNRRVPAQVLGYSRSTRRWLLFRTFPFGEGLVCFASDATDLDSRHHQIAQMTRRDPLTAVGNRQALEEAISTLVTIGEPFSVIVLDIARFKRINDTIGMSAGDRALMEYAARMKAIVPPGASVFRLGGDEFVILSTGLTGDAERFLPLLMAEIQRPVVLDGHSFTLGACVGWAAFPDDGIEMATIMRRADLALFRAKASGTTKSAIRYESQLEHEVLARVKLEHALREAAGTDQFSLHYQPKFQGRTGKNRRC